MENIIEELINIEVQADEVIAKTVEDKRNQVIRIRSKTDEIKSNAEKETTERLKIMYDTAIHESQERVKKLKEENAKWFSEMQADFDTKHVQWEDEIFNRIIGR